MTLSLNCQTILWPIRHSGHAVRWPLGIGESCASLASPTNPLAKTTLTVPLSFRAFIQLRQQLFDNNIRETSFGWIANQAENG